MRTVVLAGLVLALVAATAAVADVLEADRVFVPKGDARVDGARYGTAVGVCATGSLVPGTPQLLALVGVRSAAPRGRAPMG